MSSFASLCGIDTAARQASIAQAVRLIEATGVELVRFAWCDLHGNLRGKTLVASAAAKAMQAGGVPPGAADASLVSSMTGPPTVDGIAPAAEVEAFWQRTAAAKKANAPWATP